MKQLLLQHGAIEIEDEESGSEDEDWHNKDKVKDWDAFSRIPDDWREVSTE